MTYIPNILDVLIWPDSRLKLKSKPVTVFDEDLKQFTDDMFATMEALDGVGLAAPQVNRQEQIITIRIEYERPMVLINPEFIRISDDEYEWEEGCLSVPGYFKKKKRPKNIVILYQDVTGEPHEIECNELYAFAIQHEMDHLNGICFVDNVSRIWYPKIKNKIKKELPNFNNKRNLAKMEILKQKEK